MIPSGFEPETDRLEICCSIQLSYGTFIRKKKIQEYLNLFVGVQSLSRGEAREFQPTTFPHSHCGTQYHSLEFLEWNYQDKKKTQVTLSLL